VSISFVSQQLNDYIFRVALSSVASPLRTFIQDLKFCDTSNDFRRGVAVVFALLGRCAVYVDS